MEVNCQPLLIVLELPSLSVFKAFYCNCLLSLSISLKRRQLSCAIGTWMGQGAMYRDHDRKCEAADDLLGGLLNGAMLARSPYPLEGFNRLLVRCLSQHCWPPQPVAEPFQPACAICTPCSITPNCTAFGVKLGKGSFVRKVQLHSNSLLDRTPCDVAPHAAAVAASPRRTQV